MLISGSMMNRMIPQMRFLHHDSACLADPKKLDRGLNRKVTEVASSGNMNLFS